MTHVGRVEKLIPRPVEIGLAAVAIDALGVVPAILADATALVITVNVQRQVLLVDFRIVDALVRMPEAITACKICP